MSSENKEAGLKGRLGATAAGLGAAGLGVGAAMSGGGDAPIDVGDLQLPTADIGGDTGAPTFDFDSELAEAGKDLRVTEPEIEQAAFMPRNTDTAGAGAFMQSSPDRFDVQSPSGYDMELNRGQVGQLRAEARETGNDPFGVMKLNGYMAKEASAMDKHSSLLDEHDGGMERTPGDYLEKRDVL